MPLITDYFTALAILGVIALLAWVASVIKNDVSIVDSLWPGFFVAAAIVFAGSPVDGTMRSLVTLGLVILWAVRLAGYITWRNWGEGEDRRYQAIRKRNEPNFTLKSLYLIFIFQAFIAWIVSLPLLGIMNGPSSLTPLDYAGFLLCAFGIAFEATADGQLARFKSDPANSDAVMDKGLWRYTRHPNYFGDFCVWWGFYLVALATGAWWTFPGPLLMSFLLLKFSGVALLEEDIGERRPKYAQYIQETNAFFPGFPKRKKPVLSREGQQ